MILWNDEKNIYALEEMNKVLKYAEKGFYIFTTKTAEAQSEVVKKINTLDNVFIFDYSKNIKPYSYYDLIELINENPDTTKFIVLNFHLALQEEYHILDLNLSRDVLANHEKLWIFGMTEDMDNRLAKTAFDFYSYVMMKIRFKEENDIENVRKEVITERNKIYDKDFIYSLIQDYQKSLLTPEHKSSDFLAQTYSYIARLYKRIPDYKKALEYENKELAIMEEIYGKEDGKMDSLYNNIGVTYSNLGEYNKALDFYNKSLKIRKKNGEETIDIAWIYTNMGVVYSKSSDYDKALIFYNKSLHIYKKYHHNNENSDIARIYDNIGMVYSKLKDYDITLEYFNKALVIRKKILNEENPDIAISYNNLGLLYNILGSYDKALEYFNKALGICLKVYGDEHPDTAEPYNNIGLVYKNSGDLDKALEYFNKALGICLKVYGDEHPDTLIISQNISQTKEAQK